jgi:hypothetical protein
MKTTISSVLLVVGVITAIAMPCHAQNSAWSVGISSENPALLVIILKTDGKVAHAKCVVNLRDARGKEIESTFSFKDEDGSVLEPGVYQRFVPHKMPNIETAIGKLMFCMPPLPPGVRPYILPTPLTSVNIWQDHGITLR